MQKSRRKVILTALSTTLSAALLLQPLVAQAAASPVSSGILAKSLTKGIDAMISSRLDTSSSKPVKVIVQLDGATIAEGKYAAKMGVKSLSSEATESAISRQQSGVIASAKKSGIDLKVTYQFDTVLNGMEVELPANQIPALAQIAGVKSIYENRTYYSVPTTSFPTATETTYKYDINPLKQIGVPEAWDAGLTGKGIKVGVIDTGVDYLHPDLKNAYKGGHDSYFNTDDPYEESPDEKTGNKGTSHGTHVSGTIAARAENNSDVIHKGVAYESDLYVYKVLGFNKETGRSSGSSAQVIDGIEHAVQDGMDVINLSLGSDDAKDAFTPDSIAINNAVLAGVVAVVANGNNAQDSEQYYYSMGSPASSQLAISVGAATSPSNHYGASVSASVYNSAGTVAGSVYTNNALNVMGWYTGKEDFASLIGSEEQAAVYANLGAEADYKGLDVKDKIVFVSRGTLAFVDKIAIAKEHHAKAIVIFNGNALTTDANTANLSESIAGRDSWIGPTAYLGDSLQFIPAFDLEGSKGRALARFLKANQGASLKLAFDSIYPKTVDQGDHMADFSSRGPNSDGILGIKPDFTAPGVNILSTWPAYGKTNPEASYAEAYNRISGTSMATPHVAGLAALLQQEHPDWTPFEIRAALANTADPISDAEGTLYDVYSQGAGRVNIAEAIKTPAVLQTVEQLVLYDKEMNPVPTTNYGDNASFGVMKAGSDFKTINLQVNNTSDAAVTYNATYSLNSEVTGDPYSDKPVNTPDNSKIKVSLDGLVNGTISASAGSKSAFSLSVAPQKDAREGVYEGQVVLTAAGLPTLHIPFVVHVGDQKPDTGYGIQDLTLSTRQLSPNGDGINDFMDISFRLAAQGMNYYEITINDINDDTVGYVTYTDAYSTGSVLDTKVYTNRFDGTYKIEDEEGNVTTAQLKDGQYGINVTALKIVKGKIAAQTIGYLPFSVARTSTGPIFFPGTGAAPAPSPAPAPSDATASLKAVVGQGQQQVAVKSATASEASATVTTVTYADLQAAIGTGTTKLALVVSAAAEAGKASKLSLPADQVQLLSTAPAGSSLYLTTGAETLELPLSLLKSVPAGSGLELIIQKAADSKFATASVVGTPVTFQVNVVTGSVSKEISVPASTFIKRSFTLDKGVSAEKAGVLFLENGKEAPAPAVFTANEDGTTTVVVNRPGFSTYAVAKKAVAFNDISASWAQSRIQALAEKLLINGTSATKFSPKTSVTRAEFAAMLTRGLGLSTTTSAPFTDLKAGAWYSDAVNAAYAAGLINGYNDGSFRPDGIISRQELSVMLAKASTLLDIKATGGKISTYGDAASFGAFAKDSIAFVTAAGLMEGSSANGSTVFQPAAPTTREAAATVIYKLLQGGKLI
ncbi:S8 family serine peptidase [Paenibacillus sp. P22]|uniref:S8 family serine peptidase n=1 Tax=Paenibacillus sp. P22 TaxID=483908 RepID=UPI0004310094|nr:S8 family serine peptidase [Paenibacillus sp. P22]CDN43957.1 hypothetical protein BN871_DW_00230 [Paenibacillus sp. P22]